MSLVVTPVLGGLGSVVFGADGEPAHVGALGPITVRLTLDGPDITTAPLPTQVFSPPDAPLFVDEAPPTPLDGAWAWMTEPLGL